MEKCTINYKMSLSLNKNYKKYTAIDEIKKANVQIFFNYYLKF
jgi:hypothetical protein